MLRELQYTGRVTNDGGLKPQCIVTTGSLSPGWIFTSCLSASSGWPSVSRYEFKEVTDEIGVNASDAIKHAEISKRRTRENRETAMVCGKST